MIIIQFSGGLGNQMFQYAFGKYIEKVLNEKVLFTTGFFKTYAWHTFDLNYLNVNVKLATNKELKQVLGITPYPSTIVKKVYNKLATKFYSPPYIYEPEGYINNFLDLVKPNSFLIGYWQSFVYFPEIKEVIYEEFKPQKEPSVENSKLLELIKGTNAVSIHVRRGNYVSVSSVNSLHGVCEANYYDEAVIQIIQKVDNPVLFIFSDDILWAKENVKYDLPTHYMDINGVESAYEDLRLMYNCKHHITANSSFSWWGAWLNTNPNKIVITPKEWFKDKTANLLRKNIIPDNWISI